MIYDTQTLNLISSIKSFGNKLERDVSHYEEINSNVTLAYAHVSSCASLGYIEVRIVYRSAHT